MHLTVGSGLKEITCFLEDENKISYSENRKSSKLMDVKSYFSQALRSWEACMMGPLF